MTTETKDRPAPHSLDSMRGAHDELMQVIDYLASARDYYNRESEDESRDLGERLHSGIRALMVAELTVALTNLKHRGKTS